MTIIDVRSPEEFRSGSAKNAINIPLSQITGKAEEISRMAQPIVLCCASGARSGQATEYLKSKGIQCRNAGSWMSLINA